MNTRKHAVNLLLIAGMLGISSSAHFMRSAAVTNESEPALASKPSISLAAGTQKYTIDSSQSRFMVQVGVSGLLSALGHDHNIAIRDFKGFANVTDGSISPASLEMHINAGSLAVTDKVSASDRQKIESTMRQEVLEVDKHPEIVFRSTSVDINKTGDSQYEASVWGELTLHGVSKRLWFAAKVSLDGNSLHARGGFPLRQSDYGIKPVSVAGGTVKVKNDLKLTFDIVARR